MAISLYFVQIVTIDPRSYSSIFSDILFRGRSFTFFLSLYIIFLCSKMTCTASCLSFPVTNLSLTPLLPFCPGCPQLNWHPHHRATTENRKAWSSLRSSLSAERPNESCLLIIDHACFILLSVWTGPAPNGLAELCGNFLCGTYKLERGVGVQVGMSVNWWYD